jgi:hypothetical protein
MSKASVKDVSVASTAAANTRPSSRKKGNAIVTTTTHPESTLPMGDGKNNGETLPVEG